MHASAQWLGSVQGEGWAASSTSAAFQVGFCELQCQQYQVPAPTPTTSRLSPPSVLSCSFLLVVVCVYFVQLSSVVAPHLLADSVETFTRPAVVQRSLSSVAAALSPDAFYARLIAQLCCQCVRTNSLMYAMQSRAASCRTAVCTGTCGRLISATHCQLPPAPPPPPSRRPAFADHDPQCRTHWHAHPILNGYLQTGA